MKIVVNIQIPRPSPDAGRTRPANRLRDATGFAALPTIDSLITSPRFEFGWSEVIARKFMSVAAAFGKSGTDHDLQIDAGATVPARRPHGFSVSVSAS